MCLQPALFFTSVNLHNQIKGIIVLTGGYPQD